MMIEPISNKSAQDVGAPRELWEKALDDSRRERKAYLDYISGDWSHVESEIVALAGQAPPTYFHLPCGDGKTTRIDIPVSRLDRWDDFGLGHLQQARDCRDRYLAWRLRRKEIEAHLGWATIEAELARLADISDASTDALMEMAAPDFEALTYKILISHGDGREIEQWNDQMIADARRLTGCESWPGDAL